MNTKTLNNLGINNLGARVTQQLAFPDASFQHLKPMEKNEVWGFTTFHIHKTTEVPYINSLLISLNLLRITFQFLTFSSNH